MLLRSASQDHIDSRFDILAANPVATLQTTGMQTKITRDGDISYSEQDPFTLLRQCMQQWLPSLPVIDDIPFCGGALGYFGYDLGRRVETLPTLAKDDIQMACLLYTSPSPRD